MSSELVTKNDLKAILEQYQRAFITPWAEYRSSVTGFLTPTTGTWYKQSACSGHTSNFYTSSSDIFEKDTNGIKILKKGQYLFLCQTHINCGGNGNSVQTRITNFSTNAHISLTSTYYMNGVSYCTLSSHGTGTIDVNQIIAPEYSRYAGSQTIRPSQVVLTVLFLEERD